MNGVALGRVIFITAVAFACFACGGGTKTKPTSDANSSNDNSSSSSDTGLEAKLTVPIGDYTGCTTTVVGTRPNSTGSGGGDGTLTLSPEADGTLAAVLTFGQWLNATVDFTATSSATASLGTRVFEVTMYDPTADDPSSPSANINVSVEAGTLVIAGDTVFISFYARHEDTQLSVYSSCPIPASLHSTTIVNSAPPKGDIPTGNYASCTTSFGSEMQSRTSADDLTLTLAKSNGSLTATQIDGVATLCELAFDDTPGTTSMLGDGQTCAISEPCGPPPSLGTSSAPHEATLTNMTGAIDIAGGALFINVVGDAPADACGSHVLSLICPPKP